MTPAEAMQSAVDILTAAVEDNADALSEWPEEQIFEHETADGTLVRASFGTEAASLKVRVPYEIPEEPATDE